MPIATHLFLDPRLSDQIREYFRKRATEGAPPFECVEVPDNVERRERLRDGARGVGSAAIVVLANKKDDRDYFDGAGIRTSEVVRGLTGWSLVEFPDAMPLPPPPPVTHLLLDPRLPQPICDYFRSRAAASASFVCVDSRNSDRSSVRDHAQQLGLGAMVAASKTDDLEYFGRELVRASAVEQGPNGWFLTAFPQAIPLPPLRPSMLWSEHGAPLIPDPVFNRIRSDGLRSFGEPGAVPSFEIQTWLGHKRPGFHWLDEGKYLPNDWLQATRALVAVARGATLDTTYLWRVGKRLFILGPRAEPVVAIAAHHQLEEPTEALELLRGAIGQLNPWRIESWQPVSAAVEAACGISLAPLLKSERGQHELPAVLGVTFAEERKRLAGSRGLEACRRFLEELASRDVLSHDIEYALLFLAMSEAPLRCEVNPPEGLAFLIFVNLGGGNLVELAAHHYRGEAPRPLVRVPHTDGREFHFDGGDVRLKLTHHSAAILERRRS